MPTTYLFLLSSWEATALFMVLKRLVGYNNVLSGQVLALFTACISRVKERGQEDEPGKRKSL